MKHIKFAAVSSLVLAMGAANAQSPAGPASTPFAAGRGSFSVEALFMWFKASPTPVPLITDGYYQEPGTNVLLGGGTMDTNPNPVFRLVGTYALDAKWRIEAVGFYVPSRTTSRGVSSTGKIDSTDLLMPYIDAVTNTETFTEISFSPIYSGSAQETLTNSLGGGELNATWALSQQGPWRIDLVGGFRYLQLKEDYTINTSSPYIPPNPSDVWNTTDQFNTRNRFYGLQIGARAWYNDGPWVGSGFAKIALGTMQQQVSINGYLETNDFNNYGPVQTFPGAYFAMSTNMGTHTRNEFAVVPEVGLSVGYRVTPAATVYVGYSFLYASNVVRPGEQINRTINPTYSVAFGGDSPVKPVGPAQPSFNFSTTDFWAQSLSVGLSVSF